MPTVVCNCCGCCYRKCKRFCKIERMCNLLLGNRFLLKMKDKAYSCCVRSAIMYAREI